MGEYTVGEYTVGQNNVGATGAGNESVAGSLARRPVVMMASAALADDLGRLSAAAGCELEWVSDLAVLREKWSTAPLLLFDVETATASAAAGLPRRDGVVLVCGSSDTQVWQSAVAIGAEHVAVLPDGEAWLVGALADAVESATRPGRVLAVVGGRGGAGASVFATAVAVAAVRAGHCALLVDCDAFGGGLDLVLGAEELGGLRWPGLTLGDGRVPAAALRDALPAPRLGDSDGLTVLSCERDGPGPDAAAVRTVCGTGRRAGDTVVCDVPRYPSDPGTAALECADLVVLLVPAEVRACAAAVAVLARVQRFGAPVRLVVRGPAPGGLAPTDVSQALGLPLLATMRPQPGLAGALDRGAVPARTRGPLAAAARQVVAALHDTARAGLPTPARRAPGRPVQGSPA